MIMFSSYIREMEETKNIPEGLIDSHFHLLEMKEKGLDITSTCKKMKELAYSGGIDIGIHENDHLERLELVRPYPFIKTASGIGPWGAAKEKDISVLVGELASLFAEHTCDAIGEIGLDYYWNYGTKERQEELLRSQIELASSLSLPIIIHNREADSDMKKILSSYPVERGGIIHCFSSDIDFARFALDHNFLLSFAGPITYKKNDMLREVVRYTPSDRILAETDSPFLAPQFKRGKVNTPLYIHAVYDKIAEIKEMKLDSLIETISDNFFGLFDSTRSS